MEKSIQKKDTIKKEVKESGKWTGKDIRKTAGNLSCLQALACTTTL